MTTRSTFEHDLPSILEDLYLGRTPQYRDEALAAVRRTRQRPSWTFAGRWIPMADIASRQALVPRVPWRAVGLAILVIALLLVTALVVGSRLTRVPPPFGLAGNGLIAYSIDGDIHTTDPVTGVTRPVVTGPANDIDPVFSPDGTRIAFRRTTTPDGDEPGELIVMTAAGSDPIAVTAELGDGQPGYFEWAPSSRSLLVEEFDGRALWILDATTPAEPRVIATRATSFFRPFRPPDGNQVLIQRSEDGRGQIILLDLVTEEERVLVTGHRGMELGGARWSPTGDRVVYFIQPADAPDTRRLEIVNVDGTGDPIAVPGIDRNTFDMDAAWSQDGSRIAFIRWEQISGDTWDVRPITIYSFADNQVHEVGPRPREVRTAHPTAKDADASSGEGFFMEFSPDATKLLAIPSEASGHPIVVDLETNDWEVLDAIVTPGVAANVWQRLAP
jgi:dipeptidyl aminopeptidase/acylaminoacyl peptidase